MSNVLSSSERSADSVAGADAAFADRVRERVGQTVVGQEAVVERVLIALLTGGHLLLEGMPGLAKTLLVNAVAKAVDLQFGRVQFTIDLLPADILGSEVLDAKTGNYRTHHGPIFTNLLLADEINRAAPKVQGALLEAMQERRVTIGGEVHPLPTPFLVIATQNPAEQAGTFELPEAQLDRFMMCHRLGYPTADQEQQVLLNTLALGLRRDRGAASPKSLYDTLDRPAVASIEDLRTAMEAVQRVHVSEVFVSRVVQIVRAMREDPRVDFGASPRAGISLTQAARARAYLHNRDYVVPDDLFALAEDVLLHRMRLSYAARAEGHTPVGVLNELLAGV
ncbi:MAG: MoxR family ATPase [Tepidisphaeraceae bacterium]